jgi:hypothetical protein
VVPVVDVRNVRMRVLERGVRVPVRMWLARRVRRRVLVLVMLVVRMAVLVLDRLVHMRVVVPFAQQ